MSETGIYPIEGEPKVWVVANGVPPQAVFVGPSALRNAERWINRQPSRLVHAGFYGIDYAEYRRCCREYLSPECWCEHERLSPECEHSA